MSFSAGMYETVANKELARRRGIIQGDETIGHALNRVHSSIVAVDERLEGCKDSSFAEDLAATIVSKSALPGTQILSHAGRGNSTVAACTVVQVPITTGGRVRHEALQYLSEAALGAGVGTGYDLSETQDPLSELTRQNDRLAEFDRYLVQQNRRPVASMFTLDAHHPNVRQFIAAKAYADFSRWRANISIAFRGDDVDSVFDSLVYPIAEAAHQCGEPGVLFFDRFEADNPTPDIPYVSTAPCAEVAMAAGELCHFWIVNLEAMVAEAAGGLALDWERLRRTVTTVVRSLDAAVQMSIDSGAARIVAAKRRIGVGVTGFHAALMRLGMPYASPQAARLACQLSERITFFAHWASADLATRRGPFQFWQGSRFRDTAWLERKVAHRTGVVSDREWKLLHQRIAAVGIRHASVVAYPPVGSTSELFATSKSYEPYFSLTGQSQPGRLTGRNPSTFPDAVEQALSKLDPDEATKSRRSLLQAGSDGMMRDVSEGSLFATARQISADWHLRIHAAFQSFADESGAKTVNVTRNADLDTVVNLLLSARQLGLKGITVFRDGCLDDRWARETNRSKSK